MSKGKRLTVDRWHERISLIVTWSEVAKYLTALANVENAEGYDPRIEIEGILGATHNLPLSIEGLMLDADPFSETAANRRSILINPNLPSKGELWQLIEDVVQADTQHALGIDSEAAEKSIRAKAQLNDLLDALHALAEKGAKG